MRMTQNEHGYWEVRVKDRTGKERSISTHRKNKQEATQIIRKSKIKEIEMAAEIGSLTPEVLSIVMTSQKLTTESAVEPWLEWLQSTRHSPETINAFTYQVRNWMHKQRLKKKLLLTLTEKDIDSWINNPKLTTKASTRKTMLGAVRSFCKFVSAKGWTAGNPSALVKVDLSLLSHAQKEKSRKLIFTDEEISALLNVTAPNGERADPFWHAAVAISRWTGLRLSDIACLEWACFSVPGKMSVWTRKRDKRVELDLEPAELREAINGVPVEDPVYLFPYERLRAIDPQSRPVLSGQFKRLCRHENILGKSFHCLRHTCASRFYQAGVNQKKIMKILGHSYLTTTLTYLHDEEEESTDGSQPEARA